MKLLSQTRKTGRYRYYALTLDWKFGINLN